MKLVQKISGKTAASITRILVLLALSGCTGTEVGNGLKPKDDNDPDKDQKQASDMQVPSAKPGAGEVSDSQNSALPQLDIPLLRSFLLQECGSPLNNALQRDLILSRTDDATIAKEKIFDATVTAGAWILDAGDLIYTLTPSGLWDFKGETFIKDGGRVQDIFTCGEVTRSALSSVENSSRYRGVFSMVMTRIKDGKEFKVEWTATQDLSNSPLKAEYRLEKVVIAGDAGQATVFAIYPIE